jgi:hypothetical protein
VARSHSEQPVQCPWLLIGYNESDILSLKARRALQELPERSRAQGAKNVLEAIVAKLDEEVIERFVS